MAPIAKSVRLFGRVQGVFFRQWTIDQARRLGVAGWVRNRPDGSLEAHLEGDVAAVEQLAELMRRGPAQARVDDMLVEEAPPEDLKEFSVRL
jgi:acylphosphatase